jgi:anti-anti-sigma factor
MIIETEEHPQCVVVRCLTEQLLGPDQLSRIDQEMVRIEETWPRHGVLFDCCRLQAVSSAFLGRLVQWHQRLVGRGTSLKLCSLSPMIKQVIQVTRLDKKFDLLDNKDLGVAAFSGGH